MKEISAHTERIPAALQGMEDVLTALLDTTKDLQQHLEAVAKPKPDFRKILNEFFPRYIDVLHQFDEAIAEIRIEGHTSSEWNSKTNADEAYFLNMALSQERTRSVLEYGLDILLEDKYRKWAKAQITANGLSSSQPIKKDGLEQAEASRRVEFRVRTNAKKQIVRVLETIE